MERKIKSEKINKKQFRSKRKWILIPFLLFAFWISLSIWNINRNLGITILTYDHAREDIITNDYSELVSGKVIKGEFSAKDNNLGIVALRFNTYFRINSDVLEFRIKNKKSANWYYESSYTTPQFQPNQFFTFGFPIIADSEGEKYYFEIESTSGEHDNAVALSTIEPILETKYQYSKKLILHDFLSSGKYIINRLLNKGGENYAIDYLTRKFNNTFTNYNFLISFTVYFMPLFLYMVWLLFFDKYLFDKHYLIFLPMALMIISSILNLTGSDTVIIGLTLFWFFTALVYKLKSYFSFVFALIFISISLILYYILSGNLSENFTVWGFIFIICGIVLQIIELKWEKKELLGFSQLKKMYFK